MEVKKQEHKVWKEMQSIKKNPFMTALFRPSTLDMVGKWQYIYSSPKGEISAVLFKDYITKGDTFWEIFCIEGNLFKDTMRFRSRKDMLQAVKELLQTDLPSVKKGLNKRWKQSV